MQPGVSLPQLLAELYFAYTRVAEPNFSHFSNNRQVEAVAMLLKYSRLFAPISTSKLSRDLIFDIKAVRSQLQSCRESSVECVQLGHGRSRCLGVALSSRRCPLYPHIKDESNISPYLLSEYRVTCCFIL